MSRTSDKKPWVFSKTVLKFRDLICIRILREREDRLLLLMRVVLKIYKVWEKLRKSEGKKILRSLLCITGSRSFKLRKTRLLRRLRRPGEKPDSFKKFNSRPKQK